MRILVVSSKYPPEYAGSGLRAHRTYLRLGHRDPSLTWSVLCNGLERRGVTSETVDGVAVRRIAFPPALASGRARRALSSHAEAALALPHLLRAAPDLIHVYGISSATGVAALWARARGIPLIIEMVNAGASPQLTLPGLSRVWRPDYGTGTVIICISSDLAETARSLGLTDNVWSRPNPVDIVPFEGWGPPERDAERLRLRDRLTGFGADDVVLCAVASFIPRKRQDVLVEMMRHLPARYKLVLAGPVSRAGPQAARDIAFLESLRARVAALGLTERVVVRDAFVAAPEFMRLADLFLMPHEGEGLGTPVIEAAIACRPVIANAREPAFREWVSEDVSGLLRPLDPLAWAEAVPAALALDPGGLARHAEQVAARASVDVVDTQQLALMRGLVKGGGHAVLDVEKVLTREARHIFEAEQT